MLDFSNEFYVYRCTASGISDVTLLGIVGTSIQTLRIDNTVYFGVDRILVENSSYELVREPVVDQGSTE